MPLFYQHNINDSVKLGIWKIEEGEDFFLSAVSPDRNISHAYKRLQHLAGRYLLPVLFNDFPVAEIMDSDRGKPVLRNNQYNFSISHCGDYVAAIISADPAQGVGIDIELVNPKIERVATKFLNGTEMELLKEYEHLPQIYLQLLTVLWSAKEAIFKWDGLGKIDFKQHIQLAADKIVIKANESMQLPFLYSKRGANILNIEARFFGNVVLAWLI